MVAAVTACDEDYLPPDPEWDQVAANAKPSNQLGQGPMWHLQWAIDGKVLAYAGWGGVYFYDLAKQTELRVLDIEGNEDGLALTTMAIHPDGERAVIAIKKPFDDPNKFSSRDFFQMWNVPEQKLLYEIESNSVWFDSDILFSPDGTLFAAVVGLKDINVWRVSDGTLLHTFEGQFGPDVDGRRGSISDIDFSPDGTLLAAASSDRTAKIWRFKDFQLMRELQHPESVNSVRFSPDGKFLVSSSTDSIARIWRVSDGKQVNQFQGQYLIQSITATSDGTFRIIGSDDQNLRLWSVTPDEQVQLDEYLAKIPFGLYSADGKLFVQARGPGPAAAFSIEIYRTTDRKLLQRTGHMGRVIAVSFSPDGSMIGAGSDDNSVWLWRVSDKTPVRELRGHTGIVVSVAFSPDGKLFASGSVDQTVRLWRVADGGLIRELTGFNGRVASVTFSSDGELLATGSYDNLIRIWRVADGSLVREIKGRGEGVNQVAFSPDGNFIVAADSGWQASTVRLWRINDGTIVREFKGLNARAQKVALSADGNLLAAADGINRVLVWRIRDGSVVNQFQGYGNHQYSNALKFSPDSRLLAMGSVENGFALRVRRLPDGTLIHKSDYGGNIEDVAFNPTGTFLAAASGQTIELWNIPQ